MINPSGSISLSGITDAELAEIFEIKAKHAGPVFNFNPQQIQVTNVNTSQGTQSLNNNVVFSWSGEQGLEIVRGILSFLLKIDEKAKAQGQ